MKYTVHDLEVTGSNLGWVELGERSTSRMSKSHLIKPKVSIASVSVYLKVRACSPGGSQGHILCMIWKSWVQATVRLNLGFFFCKEENTVTLAWRET